jgi:hypothetical protein
VTDPHKEWLASVVEACTQKIREGDDNSVFHAVVMLQAKLSEMELAFNTLKMSMDSLDLQLKNTITSTYHTLIEKDSGDTYDQQTEAITVDAPETEEEPDSYIKGNI